MAVTELHGLLDNWHRTDFILISNTFLYAKFPETSFSLFEITNLRS